MENIQAIFEMIADLYEYIEDWENIEKEYILEKLAEIQNLTK